MISTQNGRKLAHIAHNMRNAQPGDAKIDKVADEVSIASRVSKRFTIGQSQLNIMLPSIHSLFNRYVSTLHDVREFILRELYHVDSERSRD